jgi:hypothetical protein
VQGNVVRDTRVIANYVLARFSLHFPPSTPDLLPNPGHQVKISTTRKDAAPEHELSCVDDHAQDIKLGLEDCCKV